MKCWKRDSRSPFGERGLKFFFLVVNRVLRLSLPVWGAWIEMPLVSYSSGLLLSLPVWGAWIEILEPVFTISTQCRSPFGERGLKFNERTDGTKELQVAPRLGSVD